jgi:hypothetical protein
VNAWWGFFDLAVNLFSGRSAQPPSQDFIMRNAMDAQEVAIGWWPGDARYGKAAFYAYAHPAPVHFAAGVVSPPAARWEPDLGEYVFDWEDVRADPVPACRRSEFRALGIPPRLRRLRMGPRPSRPRGGKPSAGRLIRWHADLPNPPSPPAGGTERPDAAMTGPARAPRRRGALLGSPRGSGHGDFAGRADDRPIRAVQQFIDAGDIIVNLSDLEPIGNRRTEHQRPRLCYRRESP